MKPTLHLTSLVLAALSLAVLPASADQGTGVKLNTKTTLTVTLAPTAAAPVGASGSAEIRIKQKDAGQKARVKLTLAGLAAGDYELDATLADASVVVIGAISVDSAGVPIEDGDEDGTVGIKVPDTIDASQIVSLALADATAVVILSGDTAVDSALVKFFANVSVTGPAGSTPPPNVHGHVVAHSTVADGVETEREFLWVGFGAPHETELTINVDGVLVGTVTSSKHGKVKFTSLDATVNLATMSLITLTDAASVVIMQAQF